MSKANRVAAIVGAYDSGKTSLLESILYTTGAVLSKGSAVEANRFADFTAAECEHDLRSSVTVNSVIAVTSFLGEKWTFIDCPGNPEFMQETYNALMIADIAIVVCEPDPRKAVYIHHVMKFLETHKIPRLIFINKIDTMKLSLKDILNALQDNSEAVLALREVPMQDDDGDVVGFVDLISERAYKYGEAEYKDNKSLHLKKVPDSIAGRKSDARDRLVEALAEYNDTLLEMLLDDKKPTRENIYNALRGAMNRGEAVPVFFGIAENDEGIFRLLKALRHDVGDVKDFVKRGNIENRASFLKVFKASYDKEIGSVYYARILDHNANGSKKIGTFYAPGTSLLNPVDSVAAGDVVALTSKNPLQIGAVYDEKGNISSESYIMPMGVMQAVSISGYGVNDEPLLLKALECVKAADVSTRFDYIKENNSYFLWGQGEQHIKCVLSRIKKYTGLSLDVFPAKFPVKKTVSRKISSHIDHVLKDAAGHPFTAAFDYVIEPETSDRLTVNVTATLPKDIKNAVADGFKEFAAQAGITGMNVTVGSAAYNDLESSVDAFKVAAQKALSSTVDACGVEFDCNLKLKITLLTDSLGALEKIIRARKARVIEYAPKENWSGYTVATVTVPKAEVYDFRNDLKAVSFGQAYFRIVA